MKEHAMSTDAPSALRADACPDAELLAAYIDGGLSPAERTHIEAHLVECADCRDIVGDTIAARPAPVVLRPRRSWNRIVVAGGLLAAAAAVILVVRLQQPRSGDIPEITRLAKAVGIERVIEPRLTGGFAHGPVPSVMRGAAGSTVPPRVIVAATEVKEELGSRSDPDSDSARGIADLLLGNTDAAISSLERAAAAAPDARRYSDLSAAYVLRARSTGDASAAQRAVQNAQRALDLDLALSEAHFNKALALEVSGSPDAPEAWRAYLARDSVSDWAREARQHLEHR
jgi:tetratricopeptide (TPR) repeat protein